MDDASTSSPGKDRWLVASLALLVNLSLMLFIGLHHPAYLSDPHTNTAPDALQYLTLGENFWSQGVYSRQLEPPYQPDVLRTPVYPLLAGAVVVLFGSIWPLYFLQILFCVGTAVWVHRLGCYLGGRRVGLWAGLICASNLMLAVINFQALSESLFVFLSTMAIVLWVELRWVKQSQSREAQLGRHALIGAILVVAILTRPGGLYLPVVMGLVEFVVLWRRRVRPTLLAPAVLVGVVVLGLAPWVVRNQMLYSIPRVTTADSINLAYFAAAGAYQVRHGIDQEEARQRLIAEYDLPPFPVTNNFWRSSESVVEMDSKMRHAFRGVVLSHPIDLARSSLIGIAKASISHNTAFLGECAAIEWSPPGLSRLLKGDVPEFARRLFQNNVVLVLVFLWQVALAILLAALGVAGWIALVRRPGALRLTAFLLGAVIAYYLVTIAVVGLEAFSRHRSMIVPLTCLLAVYGGNLLKRRRIASAEVDALPV